MGQLALELEAPTLFPRLAAMMPEVEMAYAPDQITGLWFGGIKGVRRLIELGARAAEGVT